jgi:hypothetical protein
MEEEASIEEHRRFLLGEYIKFLSVKRISYKSIDKLADVLTSNRGNEKIKILLQVLHDCTNEIEYRLIVNIFIMNPDLTNKEKLQLIFKKLFFLVAIAINNLVQEEIDELYHYVFDDLLKEFLSEKRKNYSFLSNEAISELPYILVSDRNSEGIQNLFKDIFNCLYEVALDIYSEIRAFYFPELKQRIIRNFLNSLSLSENIFDKINDMWTLLDKRITLVIALNEIVKNTKLSDKEKIQSLFNYDFYFVLLAIQYLTQKEAEEFYHQIQIQESSFQSIEVSVPVLLQTQRDDDVVVEVFEPHQSQTQHDDI